MDTAFMNSAPMRPAGVTALGADRATRIVTPQTGHAAARPRDAVSRLRNPASHTRNATSHDGACSGVPLRTRLRRSGHGAFRAIRAFGGAAFSVVVLGNGTEATSPGRHIPA
ncbi:hypothetical protein [Streptomyces axinellae]|uniref:Uncharacterized protein n=1 Tax=Streptomyces axinellae TaxID=552788 RepID=A0ABP6CQP8_9ACTN